MEPTRRKLIERKFFSGGMMRLPGNPHGELVELLMIREMRKQDVDPAVVYAYERTLLWITTDNVGSFSKRALAAWDSAQAEYYRIQNEIKNP